MAFTLKDFEAKANEDYKGLQVAESDAEGAPLLFTLRSSIRLSDAEVSKLRDAQADLEAYGKPLVTKGPDGKTVETEVETSGAEMRAKIINVLSILADKPQALRAFCRPLDLAVVMSIMTSFNAKTEAAEGN